MFSPSAFHSTSIANQVSTPWRKKVTLLIPIEAQAGWEIGIFLCRGSKIPKGVLRFVHVLCAFVEVQGKIPKKDPRKIPTKSQRALLNLPMMGGGKSRDN